MSGRAGMFAGVLIGRAITTKSHATFLTAAEMHPRAADFHALDAFASVRLFYGFDRVEMITAAIAHDYLRLPLLADANLI